MEPVWLAAKLQTPAKIPWAFKWTRVWIIPACGGDSCFHQVFLDRIIIYKRRCQHLNNAQKKKNLLTFSFILLASEQWREQKQKSFLPFDRLKKVNLWRKFRQSTPKSKWLNTEMEFSKEGTMCHSCTISGRCSWGGVAAFNYLSTGVRMTKSSEKVQQTAARARCFSPLNKSRLSVNIICRQKSHSFEDYFPSRSFSRHSWGKERKKINK